MLTPIASRYLHRAMRWAIGVVVFVVGVILYVAIVGVSIEASPVRDRAAALLTRDLGRQVRFTGPIRIEISAHPSLVVRGMRIANADGFSGSDFAELGEARLALDLWPLLRSRLRVEELQGSDVHIRLQVDRRGDNNWTFLPATSNPAPAQTKERAPPARQGAGASLGRILALLEVGRMSLQRLDVEFIDADAKSHYFELQSLLAQSPVGRPLTLALRGTVEKSYPYRLDLIGGMLADLARLDKPWPIDLRLEFMSSRLALKGSSRGTAGTIGFDLGTQDLSDFERLLQTQFPAVGDVAVSGVIDYEPGKLQVNAISGHMGKTELRGALAFDYGDARPSVKGELTLPVLDLRPFIGAQPAASAAPPKNFSDVYRELAGATFSLAELDRYDADLTLNVGKWLSLPGAVHDAKLHVKLDHGRLDVPMEVTMAEVALAGSASADASVSPPRFALVLGTHDSSLGGLAGLLAGLPDVRGTVGRLDLRVSSQGDRGAELMESLDLRLSVERGTLTYGTAAGGRPVHFSLDRLAIAIPAKEASQGEAQGALLDTKFTASLHGGSLAQIMRGAEAPLDLSLRAGSATTRIQAVLRPFSQDARNDIAFDLSAPHSREIASWLGLKPGADAPTSMHGTLHTGDDHWHLADFTLHLGRSNLAADVVHAIEQGKPLMTVQVTGDLIDEEELQSLLPVKEGGATPAPSATSSVIDIPILPQGISLSDADIDVRIARITSNSSLSVRDLRFDGHIRDGTMSASPFGVTVADTAFRGTILLDLRTQQPRAELSLAADGLDIGDLLKKLGIARDLDVGVDRLRVQLDLQSSRLGQLLAQSELAVDFEGGHLTLKDANTGAKMRVALDSGKLASSAGAAVHLDLVGSLDGAPVSIAIQTAKAVDLMSPSMPIPLELSANAFGTSIKLTGEIERPFSDRDIELAVDLSGSHLDTLDALARTSLPPWGPWSASGRFHMTRRGYELSSLLLQVGDSRLTGHGKLDTTVVPPRIDVALAAPTIQLDDFRFGDWSPDKGSPDKATPNKADAQDKPKSRSIQDLRTQAAAESDQVQEILSPEVLRRQNAYLTVAVDRVASGRDTMGSGTLEAKLQDGVASVGPVVVTTPGGSATFLLGYDASDRDVAVSLHAGASRFDYGILARRLDPKTEMSGVLSLDVDVSARASHISEVWRYGNGHVDFAVWPENLKSGLLDMWAVNVIMALLPAVDSSTASKVNCAVGRFVLNDGKLSEKTILIDTSRMRVTGKGNVDLAAEDVHLYMQPRAKTPQFLSFALPIQLAGKINDFHVGVRAADVIETIAQLATSVVTVPLQSLFGKEVPADGRDVCGVDFR